MNDLVISQIEKASYKLNNGCLDCHLQNLCFTPERGMPPLESLAIKKGEFLFEQGNRHRYLYQVQQGCIKTSTMTRNGSEQIMDFYFTDETLGFDGVADGTHRINAMALRDSVVCRIPIELFSSSDSYSLQLLHLMAQEFKNNQSHITLINRNRAEVRISTLLLNLATRLCPSDASRLYFELPLTRCDMANYLGLTVETVSRLLKQMERDGLVKFFSGSIEIIDLQQLQQKSYS